MESVLSESVIIDSADVLPNIAVQPHTLQQEFALINVNIPNVIVEQVNAFFFSLTVYLSHCQTYQRLRKQLIFREAATGFPAKWRLRNEPRNSILMTRHYPDLSSASDWSCRVGNLIQPIRSTTLIWVVTRHQYGISALVPPKLFRGESSFGVAFECPLFSQAINLCMSYKELLQNTISWKSVARAGRRLSRLSFFCEERTLLWWEKNGVFSFRFG